MPNKIYIVNVGANTAHTSKARIPLFRNGSFVFVSFPDSEGQNYNQDQRSFVKNPRTKTHADPDWASLTYGDNTEKPRARALIHVKPGDLLLFWSLLWKVSADRVDKFNGWDDFTGEQSWGFIGVMRVETIVNHDINIEDLTPSLRSRAKANAHWQGKRLADKRYIFVGDQKHSTLFGVAVDFEVDSETGLMSRTLTSAAGKPLTRRGKPAFGSSLRACRVMFDLSQPEHRRRAAILRKAIKSKTDFDFLEGL